jgi:hypothetical protein
MRVINWSTVMNTACWLHHTLRECTRSMWNAACRGCTRGILVVRYSIPARVVSNKIKYRARWDAGRKKIASANVDVDASPYTSV